MKTVFFSFLFVFFSVVLLQAQTDPQIGVKIGANLSNVKFTIGENPFSTEAPNTAYSLGYQVGMWLNVPVSSKLDFRSELAYSNERYQMSDSGEWKTSFNYIDLDLLVGYHLFKNLKMEIGPGIGKMLSAKWIVNDNETDIHDDYKKGFDVSLNFGMLYRLHRKFSIGFRYNQGLNDINEQEILFTDSNGQNLEVIEIDEISRNFQLSFYYTFNANSE